MLVQNKGKHVRHATGVMVVPGANQIQDADWKKCSAHPLMKKLVSAGEIEAMGQAQTTKDLSAEKAISLVKDIVYITINDVETGLGESYTPTADEIKACFNGWKASTVDTSGKPTAWASVVDGSAALTQTLAYVSANKAANYTPYKLSYVLAAPITETVNVEGDIVANGLTQVEVTAGVIVREKVTPQYYANDKAYLINRIAIPLSFLKTGPFKILGIYKGTLKDDAWTIWQNFRPDLYKNGVGAFVPETSYDTAAEYYVTYLAFDRQLLTANPLKVDTSFAQNVRSAVEDLTVKTSDTAASVTVHATLLYDVLKRLKAGGL